MQSIASGLEQIQTQNAVPSNLLEIPESLIDQTLSGLIPATILKSLFKQLSIAQTYTASQGDGRVRLDIVAMYLDQDATTPGISTLHVLGRSYGHPHKYFYRTYSTGVWTAWIAVTPDIESNHIVLAIWRGKLNIFWVTFVTKSKAQPAPTASPGGTPASGLNYGQLANGVYAGAAQAQVQLQQHWVEYFQGAWSDRISTDSPTAREPPS